MDNKPIADISELIQLMFVGLVGEYRETEEIVKKFHDENHRRRRGFILFESLLHQPLPKEKVSSNKKGIMVIGPFPHRLVRRTIVWSDKDIASKNIMPYEVSTFVKPIYKCWNKYEHRHWDKPVKVGKKQEFSLEFEKLKMPYADPELSSGSFFAKVKGFTVSKIGRVLKGKPPIQGLPRPIKGLTKEYFTFLKKHFLPLIQPFDKEKPGRNITSLFIPIASSQIFYGSLFVCIPHFDFKTDKELIGQLASELFKCIKKHYVPALALIHEHFFERLFYKDIMDAKDPDSLRKCLADSLPINEGIKYKSFICRRDGTLEERKKECWTCSNFGWEESSDNAVEKYLHKLWQDRKTERTKIEESLFFKDRLHTDPKMLDLLEDFLKPSKAKIKKEGDKVPSILVVAPPGAGKEDVPKLIKLFSDCYSKGRPYKLNMASLKPDAIVPVAMMGGEITWRKSIYLKRPEETKLWGILQGIREQTRDKFEKFVSRNDDKCLFKKAKKHSEDLRLCINKNRARKKLVKKLTKEKKICDDLNEKLNRINRDDVEKFIEKLKELKTEEKLIVKKLFGEFPIIVLDELNSMSVESQGVLLRFLEQAEITPIGGYEDEMDTKEGKEYREFITDFLIVGLMNEEPEELTREAAIKFLRRESYIGGLLGDLLYEHILKIRRLRPDLRSRMMRNGTLGVPKLAERRADIPISFYLLVRNAKEDYFVNSEIRTTMAALEFLMRPDLEWHENFRLLETLTKKIMEIVYEDYEAKRSRGDKIPTFEEKDLVIIREKHIKQAMKEIGMIKESERAEE